PFQRTRESFVPPQIAKMQTHFRLVRAIDLHPPGTAPPPEPIPGFVRENCRWSSSEQRARGIDRGTRHESERGEQQDRHDCGSDHGGVETEWVAVDPEVVARVAAPDRFQDAAIEVE